MKLRIRQGFVVAALLILGMNAVYCKGGFKEAVEAAINGPERQDIDIRGHGFNVKPVDIQREGNTTVIYGQISHKLRFRPDDQIYYRITKQGNVTVNIEKKLDRGGWGKIAGPVGTIVAAAYGQVIPPNQIENVFHKVGQINPDGWEQAADMIIAGVDLKIRN